MFLKVKKKIYKKKKKTKKGIEKEDKNKRTIQENHSLAEYNSFPMNYSSLLQILLIISEITSAQLMSFYFFKCAVMLKLRFVNF